jgi:hypothetical protein
MLFVDVIGIVTDIHSKQTHETNAVKVTLNDKRYYIVAGNLYIVSLFSLFFIFCYTDSLNFKRDM